MGEAVDRRGEMGRFLCDSCEHLNGTLMKTYRVDGVLYCEEYANCARRWPMAKVPRGGFCFDYDKRKEKTK